MDSVSLRKDKRLRKKMIGALKRDFSGYLFLLPAVIIFATFAWYPIVNGFLLSFQDVDLITYSNKDIPVKWVGFDNFLYIFSDPTLPQAWLNTLYFVGLGLILGYLVPVFIAMAINEMRHGQSFFRLAFYLPVILPPMISILLWKYFFDPGSGLMNVVVGIFGLGPYQWIYSKSTAMLSLVILSTWANAGGTMLIYLAAMQGIPTSLYEAAEIEGAKVRHRIWHITLPEIRGVMLIMLVLQIIGTMQVFTEPFVMTDGGPQGATTTVMLLLYRYAFQGGEFGPASALGLNLFIILAIFSLIYFRLTRRFQGGSR
jgi:multiple sugar transport system permease protein